MRPRPQTYLFWLQACSRAQFSVKTQFLATLSKCIRVCMCLLSYVMNAAPLPAVSVTTWWISSYKEQQVNDALQHGDRPNCSRCEASHAVIINTRDTRLKVYRTSELRQMKKS